MRQLAGDRFKVESSGVKPGGVRPEAIEVRRELGIDISHQRSKSVDEFAGQDFDDVITLCDHAKENGPIFPCATERIHQGFEDPPAAAVGTDESRMPVFRRVRNEIHDGLRGFLAPH